MGSPLWAPARSATAPRPPARSPRTSRRRGGLRWRRRAGALRQGLLRTQSRRAREDQPAIDQMEPFRRIMTGPRTPSRSPLPECASPGHPRPSRSRQATRRRVCNRRAARRKPRPVDDGRWPERLSALRHPGSRRGALPHPPEPTHRSCTWSDCTSRDAAERAFDMLMDRHRPRNVEITDAEEQKELPG